MYYVMYTVKRHSVHSITQFKQNMFLKWAVLIVQPVGLYLKIV